MANTKNSAPAATEEKELNTTALNMASTDLNATLAELQVKYPSWKPDVEGAILAGRISDVKDYPFMHQGKGSIMAVISTGLDGANATIAFWLNTVAQSQMLKLRNEKMSKGDTPVEMTAEFAARAEAIAELVGTNVIIQYTGEAKSQDKTKKNLNAYQKYVVVRADKK
jgi:hypothetical protein